MPKCSLRYPLCVARLVKILINVFFHQGLFFEYLPLNRINRSKSSCQDSSCDFRSELRIESTFSFPLDPFSFKMWVSCPSLVSSIPLTLSPSSSSPAVTAAQGHVTHRHLFFLCPCPQQCLPVFLFQRSLIYFASIDDRNKKIGEAALPPRPWEQRLFGTGTLTDAGMGQLGGNHEDPTGEWIEPTASEFLVLHPVRAKPTWLEWSALRLFFLGANRASFHVCRF